MSSKEPVSRRWLILGFVAIPLAFVGALAFHIAFLLLAGVAIAIGVRAVDRRQGKPAIALLVLAVGSLALTVVVGVTVLKPYRTPSESMLPTFRIGDRVIANTLASPAVGDVVILYPPAPANGEVEGLGPSGQCGVDYGGGEPCPEAMPRKSRVTFIKRIVAGPGDTIALRDGRVVLNGELQDEPYIASCEANADCNFPKAVTVPPGQWYVLGDNRGASDDARFWGPVPDDWIVGVVVARTLPLDRIEFL